MLTRDFQLKLKALDDSGAFSGYASTYGPPADMVGDIVERGAFSQSIAQQGKGYPLLWAHDQASPIGVAKVSDSRDGLICDGSLVMADPIAQRAYAHLKAGSVKGLSIGFTLPNDERKIVHGSDGTRSLREVHLHEISLCAIPANPRAQVTGVKSLGEIETLLRSVRATEVNAETLRQLRSIDAELRRLMRKDDECQCDCPECLAGDCEDCSDPDCDDPNCEANVRQQEANALEMLASDMKRLIHCFG